MRIRTLFVTALLATSAVALAGCCNPDEATIPADGSRSQQRGAMQAQTQTGRDGMVTAEMSLPTGERASSMIHVSKSAPGEVMAGQNFTYQIKVTNLTNLALSDVRVVETMPEGMTFKSATPSAEAQGGELSWNIGTLPPHASRTIVVTASTDSTGSMLACTDVFYSPPQLCLDISATRPELGIALVGPVENILCDPIPYSVMVRNTGSGAAQDVNVQVMLPEGMTTMDGQRSFQATAGTLAPGAQKKMEFQTKVTKPGKYIAAARAESARNLMAESRDVTTFVRTPSLVVSKEGPAMRYIDRPITYTITVANKGDAPAMNTVVEEKLDADTQFVDASGKGKKSADTVTWELGTIPPGEAKSVEVTVVPKERGHISSVAVARAYCGQGRAEARTEVRGIPALLLETVDLDDPIEVGSNTTYVVQVTNQGSTEATNVQIRVILPDQQEFVSTDSPVQMQVRGQEVTFQPVASIAPKGKATFKVTVRCTSPGDVRFKTVLTADQLTEPVVETESTNLYE